MPSLVKSVRTWEALRRMVSAILVAPVLRRKPIAALRRAAMISGTGSLADSARILPERDVAHVMGPILDRPVASSPNEQLAGIGQIARNAGDEIAGLV